jgi:hypothetical protein
MLTALTGAEACGKSTLVRWPGMYGPAEGTNRNATIHPHNYRIKGRVTILFIASVAEGFTGSFLELRRGQLSLPSSRQSLHPIRDKQ